MARLKEQTADKSLSGTADTPLRVLFVEDSEDDMLLELNELQQAGYIVDAVRVQDEAAMIEALREPWDLVLSDYNMPSFNGMEALKIIQDQALDIPFILVSGVIGEIAAVNLMKAGAHDYIIKNRMARLVPAIQRELKEAKIRQKNRQSLEDLVLSELRHRTLLETAADAIIVINDQGIIESVNPATEKILGYAKHELIGQNIKMLMPEPCQSEHDRYLQRFAKEGVPHIIGTGREVEAQRKDGSIFPIDLSVTMMDIQGRILYTGIIRDITERNLSEQMLQKSEARFRATFEQAAVGVAYVSIDGHWLRVNDRLCEIIGYSQAELIKTTFQAITHPDDLQTDLVLLNELLTGMRESYSIEKRFLRKDGRITWIQLTASMVHASKNNPGYFIKVVEDINGRKASEARILAALTEKDTVLRELHHRVKNNMQVVSSLLSLQARYANIKNPKDALQESRQRIRAMALIHERLYSSDDLASVDFIDYLRYLAERLSRIYYKDDAAIKIQVSGEQLQLPIDDALPCALISNELITNAIKHAYQPDQREHLLEIRIANVATNHPQIIFRDYGRGIDPRLLEKNSESLGLIIVKALTRQLGGSIELESLNGTVATLTFPLTQIINE